MLDSNMIIAARKCAGFTQETAASICNISIDTYRSREQNATDFRIGEIQKLANAMSGNAKDILQDAFSSIFLD